MERRTVVLLILIIALALFLRALYLLWGPFIDSGTLAAALMTRQAVANNYVMGLDTLGGFPTHYPYAEGGVVLFAEAGYALLGFLGVPGTIYALNSILIVVNVLLCFAFARRLTKDTGAALLSCIVFACSQTAIFTQALNKWTGDSFIATFLCLSLLSFLYFVETPMKQAVRKSAFFLGFLAAMLLGFYLWAGGSYALAALPFAAIVICIGLVIKDVRKTAVIGLIAASAGWFLFATSTALQTFVNFSGDFLSGSALAQSFIQFIGQIVPTATIPSVIYDYFVFTSAKIPYLVWVLTGFLSSVFLAAITLLKFPGHARTAEERNTYLGLVALLFIGIPFAIESNRFGAFVMIPIAVLAGVSIAVVSKGKRKLLLAMLAITIPVSLGFFGYQILTTQHFVGFSSSFGVALNWIAQNTPPNATFLADPQDGLPIQYWANRTTYSDTNIALRPTDIENFDSFLYARAGNFSYLQEIRPDYLLLHDIATGPDFNGSNVQYLIEWALSPHKGFYYGGINFSIVYANFSLSSQQNRTIIYRLSYNGVG